MRRHTFIILPKKWRTPRGRTTTVAPAAPLSPGLAVADADASGVAASPIPRPFDNRFTRTTGRRYAGGYPGAYPFVGSPDDIAAEMARMSATGLAGCTVAFVDYLKEIPFFVQEVLPRLERLGLRQPV